MAQQTKTTTTNTTRHLAMSLFSLEPDNLAFLSKVALALGGLALAVLSVMSLIWEERADARTEERDAKYRHEINMAQAASAERVKELEARTAEANRLGAEANERAAAANERAARLELALAEQKLLTSKAQSGVTDLQIRLRKAGYAMSVIDIGSKLDLRSQRSHRIEISNTNDDAGLSAYLASELRGVLIKAGWSVAEPKGGLRPATPPAGIVLRVSTGEIPEQARALLSLLQNGGHPVRIVQSETVDKSAIEVLIDRPL